MIVAPALLVALPFEAIGGGLAGAALYTIGGVVYAVRRPDPFPSVFGYHEVFHLLVIAGAHRVWRGDLDLGTSLTGR